ncbi:MAG: endo-1,4-beta-xylanase [Fuerstiella sp.]|nr:endo-1,4-beta-xylanase [Fuerstiella sp.]
MKSIPLLMGLLYCSLAFATDPSAIPTPRGERLRDIVATHYPGGNVYIGGTTNWGKLARGSGVVLDREFGYVTPENDFKQSGVHPTPDRWNWERTDAWVARCAERGQVLRMHAPIGPQCSRWAMADDRTAGELSRNLTEYMTAICKRYDGKPRVKWLDVVNETVTTKGEWHGPRSGTSRWENPWTIIGFDINSELGVPLYIKMAFEIATRHAPNTELVLNQHGSMEQPMWDKIKATILYLRAAGLRVDGLGWQAHIDVGWENKSDNLRHLGQLIDWAHANDLTFHITENNVWLKDKEKDYDAQARTFGAIVKTLVEKSTTGVVTWNVWNISDGDSWSQMAAYKGCILYDDFSAKPAYYAIQKTLMEGGGK